MLRKAKPDRFIVDRKGTPDPEDSVYYVLDVVHDPLARVVLWMLVRSYRNANGVRPEVGSARADELEQLLKETDEACTQNIEARNVSMKQKVGRPKSARPR